MNKNHRILAVTFIAILAIPTGQCFSIEASALMQERSNENQLIYKVSDKTIGQENRIPSEKLKSSNGQSTLKVVFSLLMVIGLIIFLTYLIKKVAYGQPYYSEYLKIKACLPLSQREKIVVVEVAGENILIGVASGYVGLIKSVDGPDSKCLTNSFPSQEKKVFSERIKEMILDGVTRK